MHRRTEQNRTYHHVEHAGLGHVVVPRHLEVHIEILLLERARRGLEHHDDLGGELEARAQRHGLGVAVVGDLVGFAGFQGLGDGGLEGCDVDALGGVLYLLGELATLGGLEGGDEVGDVGHGGDVGAEGNSRREVE